MIVAAPAGADVREGDRMDGGAKSAARWLRRWVAATAGIGAVWVVVTLAQGGRLHGTVFPCPGDHDANVILIAAMSAAIAAPLAAAWAAASERSARGRLPWFLATWTAAAALLVLVVVAILTPVCAGRPAL